MNPGPPCQTSSSPEPQQQPSWCHHVVVLTVIALGTFAAFWPTLANGFVNWDDVLNILDNTHYRGFSRENLRWMFTNLDLGHYMPLSWLTMAVDYSLWGMDARGYHLTSLLLHITSAVVLFGVLARLLKRTTPWTGKQRHVVACFAALLWAIHPLRAESVAWATERPGVLAGLFFMLSLASYLRFVEATSQRVAWFALTWFLFVCSLLSKTTGVMLPAALLVLDAYPLGRLKALWSPQTRRLYAEKVLLAIPALTAVLVAVLAKREFGALKGMTEHGLLERLAQCAYSTMFYIWKTVFPIALSPLYPLTERIDPWQWQYAVSALGVLAITLTFWRLRQRCPWLLTVWLFYLIMLLPMAGLSHSGVQLVADRYSYLSCLGWPLLIAAGLKAVWERGANDVPGSASPALVIIASAVMFVVLSTLTWRQTRIWHDSVALWTHALSIHPRSAIAHSNLGAHYYLDGQIARAVACYKRANECHPGQAQYTYNLGRAYADLKQFQEARLLLEESLYWQPANGLAHYYLGFVLDHLGEPTPAAQHYAECLKYRPDHMAAHLALAVHLTRNQRHQAAKQHLEKALEANPRSLLAHYNLGNVLVALNDLDGAIAHYRTALQIAPNMTPAQDNLAQALRDKQRLRQPVQP